MSKLNLIKQVLLADDAKLKEIESVLEVVNDTPETKEETVQLMEESPLNDGTTMVVADPAFEAGASIMIKSEDGTEIPMPPTGEGEAYELQDGRQFTVAEEGVIAEVKEGGEEEEEAPEGEEEMAMNNKPNEQPIPKVITESVVKETKFSAEAQAKINELETKLSALENKEEETTTEEVELTVEPITHNPEEAPSSTEMKFQWGKGRQQSAKDRVFNRLSNKK